MSKDRHIKLPWFRIILVLLLAACVAGAFFGVRDLISGATHRGNGAFDQETPVEGKDLTLDNDGFLGYTAADFADAVLGDETTPKKLQVYTVEVDETVTVTEAGLANLVVFSKVQDITYHGVATYTVNLANINQYCFTVDNEAQEVTVYVPHASLESVNIPASRMEFGEVERGILAFGDITLTPQEQTALEAAAQTQMEKKLLEDHVPARADASAKIAVRDIYQPIISKVAPGYTVAVAFLG